MTDDLFPSVFRGRERNSRRETFGAEQMVTILGFRFGRQEEKLVTRIVQAIDEPARRSSGMRTAPNLHEPFFHPDSHPLVEDETFSLPVFVPELLLVGRDSAVQLKDILESLAAEKR